MNIAALEQILIESKQILFNHEKFSESKKSEDMDDTTNVDFNEEEWQELSQDFCSFEKEAEERKNFACDKSSLRKSSLFTIYAKVFRAVLSKWIRPPNFIDDEEHRKELDELILPSNEEWRHQVYYRLVELQRLVDRNPEEKEMDSASKNVPKEKKEYEWEPRERNFPLRPQKGKIDESISSLAAISGAGGSMTEACIEPGWRIRDIILAAKVLQKEDPPQNYADEAEMRRVFGLVYDVLRYRHVLNHALEDVGFWYHYKEHRNHEKIVWLLLYDMQGRKFARLGSKQAIAEREKAFHSAGLKDVEDSLLETKTHLAASVSRLRIGGSALTLDDLLPAHLKSVEGICWSEEGAIGSGWVNSLKIPNKKEFIEEMEKLGFRHCADCKEADLGEKDFVFDPICPKVINFHEKSREKLATSDLVRSHRFIFLERSLCLGTASLAKAVRLGKLCGPVILTQCIAPRHTGYVASLLADIEGAGRLLAFGTGDQRCEYETYLRLLGVTLQQCRIFSEKYVSPPASAELERATIILATPHCSFTGVNDIVDLAVARGGDTVLLESLTNDDNELKQPRLLLADQLATLKYALTKPNVQLLIYEVHSILPSETTEMVNQVVEYANGIAKEKYARESSVKKKIPKETGERSPKSLRPGKRRQSYEQSSLELEILQSIDEEEDVSMSTYSEINIPDSDLFEVSSVGDMYGENCDSLLEEGCYIAFIKRKEMMQFDSLFMIKVAESKGLFGDPSKQHQKKEEVLPTVRQTSTTSRRSFKRAKIQIDRIAAPTHSSMLKTRKESHICPRHSQHVSSDEISLLTQNHTISKVPFPSIRPSSPANDQESIHNGGPRRLLSLHDQEKSAKRLSTLMIRPISGKIIYNEPDRSKNQNQARPISPAITFGTHISTVKQRNSLSNMIQFSPLSQENRNSSLENGFQTPVKASFLKNFPSSHVFIRKISRIHHPGGSLRDSRSPVGSRLETVIEQTKGFPYLFPGTGNASVEGALDYD